MVSFSLVTRSGMGRRVALRRAALGLATPLAALVLFVAAPGPGSFHFVILGDRTGEAQPGVFEQALREAAAENPVFVLSAGDNIEGLDDASAETEWRAFEQILAPYRQFPFYPAPGNHDVWSEKSEKLFRKYTGHAPHYSFDYGPAHFTILDNSRSEWFSTDEQAFLEKDLEAHAAQPVKFIVSHRPSWLIDVVLRNPNFKVQQLAKKYGARYVIAGHVHQMLHVDLDGVTYASVASSGGHLRLSKSYEAGWFFGYTVVEVNGKDVRFQIKELKPPNGQGRVTSMEDWGFNGLLSKREAAGAAAK